MEALLPSSISPKIHSILHSHVYPRMSRVFRALAKFKSLVLDHVLNSSKNGRPRLAKHLRLGYPWAKRSKKKSKLASFMKLQLSTWAGSPRHVKELEVSHRSDVRYNNLAVPAEEGGVEESEYLCWLEERVRAPPPAEDDDDDGDDGDDEDEDEMNEIDRLAEKFIARCHEKFLLEKQESYRRYQEMMARSM